MVAFSTVRCRTRVAGSFPSVCSSDKTFSICRGVIVAASWSPHAPIHRCMRAWSSPLRLCRESVTCKYFWAILERERAWPSQSTCPPAALLSIDRTGPLLGSSRRNGTTALDLPHRGASTNPLDPYADRYKGVSSICLRISGRIYPGLLTPQDDTHKPISMTARAFETLRCDSFSVFILSSWFQSFRADMSWRAGTERLK